MPVSHEVDEVRNVVITRVEGPVDAEALIDHLTRVKQDARLRPGYRSWFDLSDAEPGDIGGDVVRRAADVARRFDEHIGEDRVAILAPGDLVFGLARMYSMLVDTLQADVRVFRDAAAARAWLCLSEVEGESAA